MVLAGGQVLTDRPTPRVKTALQAGIDEPLRPRVLPADESPTTRTVSSTAVSEPAPPAPSTVTTTPPPPATPSAAPVSSVETPKTPGRELRLHGGKFQLNLDELPLIGSAQASNVIVSLFDYTCHYCRDLHGLLAEAQKRFSNRLAIVSLPMPLDGSCNHLVARTQAAHQQACQYAALGLAVWRAQPESFQQFDTWLFTPSPPPSVSAVKSYADGLVGREKLERALTDGWVAGQIQTDISIYEANTRQLNNDGRMPQLIIGSTVNAGPIDRIDELYRLLGDHLGLRANP